VEQPLFWDIGTGMEPVEHPDDLNDDPVLLERILEFERVRNRGAVEARSRWVG